jgi:hypothetical protein
VKLCPKVSQTSYVTSEPSEVPSIPPSPLAEVSPSLLEASKVYTHSHMESQNQLERNNVRNSKHVEKRARTRPYTIETSISTGPVGRGGTKATRQNKGKKKQASLQPEEEEVQEQQTWAISNKPAQMYKMTFELEELVTKLCWGSVDNLISASTLEWIRSMDGLIHGSRWISDDDAFVSNSLKALAARCNRSQQVKKGIDFVEIFNMLNLTAKTNGYVSILLLLLLSLTVTK